MIEATMIDTTRQVLDWGETHVHLFQFFASLAGIGTFATGGFVTWLILLTRHRQALREYRSLENPGVVVVEAHVLKENEDNTISLDVVSWGGKHTFTGLLHDQVLEKKLGKVARLREGFIRLEQPGQLLFMDGLQTEVVGNDSSANLDALKGRPTNEDWAIMCPVTWPGLRAAHLIRIVIIDEDWMDRLCDPDVISRIKSLRPRYQHRSEWLYKIALAWREERYKSEEEASMRRVKFDSQRLK